VEPFFYGQRLRLTKHPVVTGPLAFLASSKPSRGVWSCRHSCLPNWECLQTHLFFYFQVTSIAKKCANTSRFGVLRGSCFGLRM